MANRNTPKASVELPVFPFFSAIGTHHVGMANSCLLLPFREEGKWRAYPVSECCYCDESILCMFIRLSVYVAVSLFMFYFVRWCLICPCLFVLFFYLHSFKLIECFIFCSFIHLFIGSFVCAFVCLIYLSFIFHIFISYLRFPHFSFIS